MSLFSGDNNYNNNTLSQLSWYNNTSKNPLFRGVQPEEELEMNTEKGVKGMMDARKQRRMDV